MLLVVVRLAHRTLYLSGEEKLGDFLSEVSLLVLS